MSPLLNYSTSVDAQKTLGEVQALLRRARASQVTIDYGSDGQPVAVAFVVRAPWGDAAYRLPANAGPVLVTLERQRAAGRIRRGLVTQQQAGRVAWRIVKDWLEAQLAIIEAGLVSLDQVMLPYAVVDEADGRPRTLYDAWREHRGALPGPDDHAARGAGDA